MYIEEQSRRISTGRIEVVLTNWWSGTEMPRNLPDRETGEIIPAKYGVEVDVPATYRSL